MNLLITIFFIQALSILLGFMKIISQKLMINSLRFSYAAFLLFSGFVKILDPLGFSYKLQEYFEVFGMEWLFPFTVLLSVLICALEIFIGIFLALGTFIRQTLYVNLVLMIGFTFLTFYSAYFNVVTDCGCFGDFMKLDPWFSFQKDIILVIVSVVLFFYQSKITFLLKQKDLKLILASSLCLVLFIPIYGLSHLPLIDFRAYKIGSNIVDGKTLPLEAKKDVFQDIWFYEINGQITEFNTSEEPWNIEGAVFKDRETKLIKKGDEPLIKDFDIIDSFNDIDMTDSILSMDYVLLVVSYDINTTNAAAHSKINNVLLSSNIPTYGLSSSSSYDVEAKLFTTTLPYPYFLVDQTTLKTMVRSNPGVVLLHNGTVIDKWHWRDVPKKLSSLIN